MLLFMRIICDFDSLSGSHNIIPFVTELGYMSEVYSKCSCSFSR